MQHGSRRAVIAALLANAGIAVAKFAAFVITGSASMLAESVHSVADSGNQSLLLLGGKRAEQPATELHPFGHGRERYFWSFVVALVLFSLGSMFAIYEGANKLIHPHELESPMVAFVVLGIAIVLEAFSFRTAVREAQPLRRGRSWWRFIRTETSPELPVVLLEDLGAQVGLLLALIGVSLTTITDDPTWDALGTISIGILLGVIAIILAIEMKSLLIGESASKEERLAIRAAIVDGPDHPKLIYARTQYLGPDSLLLVAKVDFGDRDADGIAPAIDALEARVRAVVPHARHIYVEPDRFVPGHLPPGGISPGDAAPQ